MEAVENYFSVPSLLLLASIQSEDTWIFFNSIVSSLHITSAVQSLFPSEFLEVLQLLKVFHCFPGFAEVHGWRSGEHEAAFFSAPTYLQHFLEYEKGVAVLFPKREQEKKNSGSERINFGLFPMKMQVMVLGKHIYITDELFCLIS